MSEIVVVKLGGSAITVKSDPCTPRLDVIHRALDVVAGYRNPLVLLHGAGSFAHQFISEKIKKDRFRNAKGRGVVSEVELNLDQLTRMIGVGLLLRSRPFVPIHPMSFLTLKGELIVSSFLSPFRSPLRSGLVPLSHGDLAVDVRGGFGIVSADRIASLLGEKMSVSRVLFGCDVDGIYEGDPKRKPSTGLVDTVDRKNSGRVLRDTSILRGDVTGGMHGKVKEALRLAKNGVESYVFNLNDPRNLRRLLHGSDDVGTRFVAWKN